MKKVACYARVSTQEQAEHGFSIGEQKERMIAYCKAKGWIVYDVYIDGGYSGSSLNRPAIQKLKNDITNFDIVLVYKLDRLSRSQFDILDLIEKTFLPNDVDFVSMSESFDTSTPFGRAMIGILGVFAQLEREQIRERSIMGRKARAKEGKWHGGEGPPTGYDYVSDKLVINEYEAEQIRLIFEMCADNKSNAQILAALKEQGYTTKYGSWKDESTISRLIKKNVYLGTITYDDIVTKNAHESIISQELFDKANAVRKRRNEIFGRNVFSRSTLLSGFIWCSRCKARYGTTISRHKKPGEPPSSINRYHACYSRAFPNSKMATQKGCKNKIWRVDALEKVVNDEIHKLVLDHEYFNSLVGAGSNNIQINNNNNAKKVKDIDKQILKLMDLYTLDSIPFDILSVKIEELQKKKSEIISRNCIEEKVSKKISSEHINEFKTMLTNLIEVWDMAEQEQKRFLLSSLINAIYIDGDNIIFDWIFVGDVP